jgi:isoleucyl-tRNA synthetase
VAEDGGSIHLQDFPKPLDRDAGARPPASAEATAGRPGAPSDQIEELLKLRAVIGQAIEHARQEKLIANTLEARVVLNSDSDVTNLIPKEELEEFFIVSDLEIQQTKEPSALVTKTPYQKCARCWRHRPAVGASKAHPDLCDRCESVVSR